jgi:hypothetical protein
MSKYKSERGVHLKRELFYEWNNPDAEYSVIWGMPESSLIGNGFSGG